MATRIAVDFNDVEPDGSMDALTDHADGVVGPGLPVVLHDADGNVCVARVLSVVNNLVRLEVKWDRWNKVNTLLDALEDSIDAVKAHGAAFDTLFERPLTEAQSPRPHKKLKIPA